MARFFLCRPSPDGSGKQSVFAINLDRVKTIQFVLVEKRCIGAKLELDREVEMLRAEDAESLYDVLK